MIPLSYFSPDYQTARRRFRSAAAEANALLEHHGIIIPGQDGDDELSTDVAFIGSESPEWTLMVTSGLHGVEGFFGSAIQLALLAQFGSGRALPSNGRIVLVHAINPYGFHFLRRTNEENIDLNRNFLLSDQVYAGLSAGYDRLNQFLNPQSPPLLLEPLWLKALALIIRVGKPTLKVGILSGQYDYPKGLFFGGPKAARSTCIIQTCVRRWLAGAQNVVHIDFHTGLGAFGTYKLLLPVDTSDVGWYQTWFGYQSVEETVEENGTVYRSTGSMGRWLNRHLSDLDYRYFNAEFGTYPPLRTLGALRNENCAHFHAPPGSAAYKRAKAKIKECFCPASKKWRISALRQGLGLVDRSIEALCSKEG
jgi:hypothetical protein